MDVLVIEPQLNEEQVAKVRRAQRRKNNLHPQKRNGSNGYDHPPTKYEHRADLGRNLVWLRRKHYHGLPTQSTWPYQEPASPENFSTSHTESIDSVTLIPVEPLVSEETFQELCKRLITNPKVVYFGEVPKCLAALNGKETYDLLKQIQGNNEFARIFWPNTGTAHFFMESPSYVRFANTLTQRYIAWAGYNQNNTAKGPDSLFVQTLFDKNLKVSKQDDGTAVLKFEARDEFGNKFLDEQLAKMRIRKQVYSSR